MMCVECCHYFTVKLMDSRWSSERLDAVTIPTKIPAQLADQQGCLSAQDLLKFILSLKC